MPHRYSLSHDLKRFAVEFLCLLLVLQGFPAQALPSARPTTLETSTEDFPAKGDVGPLEAARRWIGTATETTRQAFEQPWSSAIGLMLGLSAYAVPQDEAAAALHHQELVELSGAQGHRPTVDLQLSALDPL